MSVYQDRAGRWIAQVSQQRKKRHVGSFSTEAEARAAEGLALAALPPKPRRPRYLVENRGYETPCWVWQWAKTPKGYGTIAFGREDGVQRWQPAHRYFYEQHVGPIPDGYQIDHLCRFHDCVNPAHLEVVTQAENIRRGANTKLTQEQVSRIRASDEPARSLAARYGVHANTIYSIRGGVSWRPDRRTERLAA